MSIEAVATALHHSKATPTAKLVLVALAWHVNEDRVCYPSQETLAHYAGINVRQVRRAVTQLIELGEIEVWKHGGKRLGSTPGSNLYFMVLECPESCDQTLQHKTKLAVINGIRSGNKRYA